MSDNKNGGFQPPGIKDPNSNYWKDKGAGAFAGAAAITGLTSGIIHGLGDTKDYCLSAGKGAEQAGTEFAKNFLDIFGGMGSMIFGAVGYKSPLDKMQEELKKSQQQYRAEFDQYTQTFAKMQVAIDEDILEALNVMQTVNQFVIDYYNEMLSEKIQLNTFRIVFLFVFIFLIYIYIIIE